MKEGIRQRKKEKVSKNVKEKSEKEAPSNEKPSFSSRISNNLIGSLAALSFAAVLFFVLICVLIFLHWGLTFVDITDAPGEVVGVGYYGQKIHMHCKFASDYPSEPVVMFEPSVAGFSLDYYLIQDDLLAQGISSCAYDRPGYGFSPLSQQESDNSVDLKTFATTLYNVIQNSPNLVQRKLVFCSSGFGALISRYFAHQYPEMVAGVFLYEPFTEFDNDAAVENQKLMAEELNGEVWRSSFGLIRVMTLLTLHPYQDEYTEEELLAMDGWIISLIPHTRLYRRGLEELTAVPRLRTQLWKMVKARPLTDLPLAIFSTTPEYQPMFDALNGAYPGVDVSVVDPTFDRYIPASAISPEEPTLHSEEEEEEMEKEERDDDWTAEVSKSSLKEEGKEKDKEEVIMVRNYGLYPPSGVPLPAPRPLAARIVSFVRELQA